VAFSFIVIVSLRVMFRCEYRKGMQYCAANPNTDCAKSLYVIYSGSLQEYVAPGVLAGAGTGYVKKLFWKGYAS
jgi:hypothetical protein